MPSWGPIRSWQASLDRSEAMPTGRGVEFWWFQERVGELEPVFASHYQLRRRVIVRV